MCRSAGSHSLEAILSIFAVAQVKPGQTRGTVQRTKSAPPRGSTRDAVRREVRGTIEVKGVKIQQKLSQKTNTKK